jgi:hypothetical protein
MGRVLRRVSIVSFVVLSVLFMESLAAQPPAGPAKGRVVTLKTPLALFEPEGISMAQVAIFGATVTAVTDTALTVGGVMDWQTAGFPLATEFKVEKAGQKDGTYEVELRSKAAWLKLRFDRSVKDVPRAFEQLVFDGPAASYLPQAYATIAGKFFAGPLQSVPPDKQQELVRFAHITASGTQIKSQTYKENLYMVVDLGRDTNVYNDLRFSQPQLVAHVLNERLLKTLKAFANPIKDVASLHGLKLEYKIPHYSFAEKYAAHKYSDLQLYAPAADIRKFADADITNQQFVDACVVIFDDNRVEVSLAASGD